MRAFLARHNHLSLLVTVLLVVLFSGGNDDRSVRIAQRATTTRERSSTSTSRPWAISVQASHVPQGSAVGPFSQFTAFATRRAAVVFPTPRGPVKRKACASRPLRSAFESVRTTCS